MHLVWKAIKTYIVYQKVPDASEYKGRSGAMNFHKNVLMIHIVLKNLFQDVKS